MDPFHLVSGLFLFIGGLAIMVLGVLYLALVQTCTGSSCGGPEIAYAFFIAGVIMIVLGALFLAKARFAFPKPFPRQYSRI